jgi:G6PDH family F420-dependent oxidoreductase
MVAIGYMLACEQRTPKELVQDAILAERAGFDFAVITDHFHPWVAAQGHASYAWTVLGAVAQATERIPLMTYATTPTIRYHPVIVAQKAATMALLAEGRFRLGLGAGENLNEHVVGRGFPPVDTRHEMLIEAVEIIRLLWEGGYVTYHGKHFDVETARLFDRPEVPPPLGIACSGRKISEIAGKMADLMIATEPKAELVQQFAAAGGTGKPVVGQPLLCWGADEAACRRLAREQCGWAVSGWTVMAELPNPSNFERLLEMVSEEQVAEHIPCGPDINRIVQAVTQFSDAGFTEVVLCQIGQNQAEFCELFARELAPALRQL